MTRLPGCSCFPPIHTALTTSRTEMEEVNMRMTSSHKASSCGVVVEFACLFLVAGIFFPLLLRIFQIWECANGFTASAVAHVMNVVAPRIYYPG